MPRANLGRLANAPLAYVIAQVQFGTILAMEKLVPDVQAALRADYPRFAALQGLSIIVGAAGPVQAQSPTTLRWDFGSETNRRGVILQSSSITFHTAEYATYDAFAKELTDVLTKAQDTIPDMFVKRVGLRYVDVVIPGPGESPNLFVEPTLRCDPGNFPGVKNHQGITALVCDLERGQLNVKYYVSGKHNPANLSLLPPDLEPFPLTQPDIMKKAQAQGYPLGVLDTDRFIDGVDQRYNADTLKTLFDELHGDISTAFHQFTSDHARQVWSKAGAALCG